MGVFQRGPIGSSEYYHFQVVTIDDCFALSLETSPDGIVGIGKLKDLVDQLLATTVVYEQEIRHSHALAVSVASSAVDRLPDLAFHGLDLQEPDFDVTFEVPDLGG